VMNLLTLTNNPHNRVYLPVWVCDRSMNNVEKKTNQTSTTTKTEPLPEVKGYNTNPHTSGWRNKFTPNAEYYERSKNNILKAIQGTIKGAEIHTSEEARSAHQAQYNSLVQSLAKLKAKALRDNVKISYTVPSYPDYLKYP